MAMDLQPHGENLTADTNLLGLALQNAMPLVASKWDSRTPCER